MEDELPSNPLFQTQLKCLVVFAVIMGLTAIFLNNKQQNITATAHKNIVAVKINAAPTATKSFSQSKPANSSRSDDNNQSNHHLHPIIIEVAQRYEIEPALVNAIIMVESGYNPTAISKRGAKGLMQLMPATAEALGVEDSFNPKQNIDGGVRYFKQLVDKFDGDVKLALAAYNAGSRNVRLYQGIPPFKATRFYIKKVFKYYRIFKNRTDEAPNRA